MVVLAAGGGFLATRGKDKPVDTTTTTLTPPPEKPKTELVKITVSSDPAGARVFRADTGQYEDGRTPLTFTVKKGNPSNFEVQVKLDGYKSALKSLVSEKDVAVLVQLEKEVAAVVPVADVTPPVVVKKEHHHSSSTGGEKPKKQSKEEGGDDMKLLQPKF